MDASTLKGRAVVSLTEGAKLGSIAQPLFDPQMEHLCAFEMKGDEGIFILPFGQVQSIGADAITVASHQVVHGSMAGTLIELDQVMHMKVVDRVGTFLGEIAHVDIDPTNGNVVRIATHKGGMLGIGGTTTPIEPATILSVGPDLITLDAEVALSVA